MQSTKVLEVSLPHHLSFGPGDGLSSLPLFATSTPLSLQSYLTSNKRDGFDSSHQIIPATAAPCSFPLNLGLLPSYCPLFCEDFILCSSLSPVLLYSNSCGSQHLGGYSSTTFLVSWFLDLFQCLPLYFSHLWS